MRQAVRRWAGVLALVACMPGAPVPAESGFEPYQVVTGYAKRQTVVTGFLLDGDVAELATVSIDENRDRRLRVYGFEDGVWAPKLDATLRPEVSFLDVASIGGRDRLITYEPGRLNWFDPESATERALVGVTCSFDPPREAEVPHVDISRDVNDDDLDDLVVPGPDGFLVFIQTTGGTFADPVNVGRPPDLAGIYGADGYRYDPWSWSRIHEMDYDLDGRSDLVFWNEDHFEVHLQDERGLLAAAAESFTTEVAFDSDDLYSLIREGMTGRVLQALADLNGDGVGDLVVYSLQGKGIAGKHSAYEVHLGKPAPEGGTVFSGAVDLAFRSPRRIQLKMERLDLEQDGRVDVMVTTIGVEQLQGSLWKRLKGFMGDDAVLDLEFYRNRGGRYRDRPDTTRRIALDGAPSHREPGWVPLEIVLRGATHESRTTRQRWPRAFNRTLLIGDVTGDRRADLLIEPEYTELDVLAGVPGRDVFAWRPRKVRVALHDGEYAWLMDLNRDGKQDIVVHHPFTERNAHGARKLPPGTEPHRVTMLFAR